MKQCTKCNQLKNLNEFNKRTSSKDGLRPQCRECESKSKKKWRENNNIKIEKYNKKYNKKYYQDNKIRERLRSREWKLNNIDKVHEYRKNNKVKIQAGRKRWNENNKDKINKYPRDRRRRDPAFKILGNLRNRLYCALKGNSKPGSIVKDLGCSTQELKLHLESKFQSGMSWDNYGLFGWHIDHIDALKNFNLTDRNQFLKACHYTNLQPLWAKDNIFKGCR